MNNVSLEERVDILENNTNRIYIRSEITLGIISGLIANGLMDKNVIDDFVKNISFKHHPQLDHLVEGEKESVLKILHSVKIRD